MAAIGTFAIGTAGIGSTLVGAPPTVDITSPLGTITTPTIAITWTYSSPLSRPQKTYRITLSSGGTELLDTGVITSAAVTHALDYSLSPFISYDLLLIVSDGVSTATDPVTFFVEFTSAALVDDNPLVGSVYEIGINGDGFMLADHPEQDSKYKRQTVQLDPQAPGSDAPFSERIDRYNFIAHSDWTAGEGQLYLDRPTSNPSRYFYSEWIDPFTPGEISCLPAPQRHIETAYTATAAGLTTVASDIVFTVTSATQFTSKPTPAGSTTTFAHGLAGTLLDVASDGTRWYATDGVTVRRNATAANPGSDWSTEDVTEIEWIGDRIGAIDSVTGPNFTTLAADGSEENVGGIQTFVGATLQGICGGDGFAWFGVNYTMTGHVRAWELGAAPGSTTIAFTLPEGETVDNLYYYLGNVFVASRTEADFCRIYRCVPSEGRLTPEFVTEFTMSGMSTTRITFAGNDRFVAFAWPTMNRDDESGIGVIDLESGGFARWYAAGGSSGGSGAPVRGVVRWADDFGFALMSATTGGFYGKDATPALEVGFVETSTSDLASNVTKVLDSVTLTTKPLAGSVAVAYSSNSNQTWVSLGTMSGSGATSSFFDAGIFSPSFAFRLTLTPAGDESPVVKMVAGKTHPLGLADQVVTCPVDCADNRAPLSGNGTTPDSRPGRGREIARLLESLVGTAVSFQDVDWPDEPSSIFQVVGCDLSEASGSYSRHRGKRLQHAVATITLRRGLS